ncbi:MAG: hypothetical protein IKJ26_11530 [Clostridia bacterium]|nr:hypothetical protein [Clostridia bacterium]
MLSTRAWRIYRLLLALILLAVLVPTTAISFYMRPLADDMTQPYPVLLTWRETGSLLKTISTAFRVTWDIYNDYSGIFFSMFLSTLPFSIFGVKWTWVNAVIAIVLFLWAVWRAAGMIPLFCKGIRPEVTHCAAMLLTLLMLLFMPSYHEALYWFSASINYTCVMAMGVGLFTSLIRALFTGKTPWWKMALWCLGFFLMGGGNWITSTTSIVVWGALCIYIVWKKQPKRMMLPFAFLLAGYLIAILAPGTANRQASMNVDVGLIAAFIDSFEESLAFLLRDTRWYIFMLLMIPVAVEIAARNQLKFRFALWLPLLSLCVLAASMFPLLYQSSYWGERHTDACYLILMFLLPINLFWLVGWLFKRLKIRLQKPFDGRVMLAAAMAVMLAVGGMSVNLQFNPLRFNCNLQAVTAFMHLLDGQAREYADWYDSVAELVRTHPGEDIVLTDMRANKLLNPSYLVNFETTDWMNEAFAQYYGENNTIVYQP